MSDVEGTIQKLKDAMEEKGLSASSLFRAWDEDRTNDLSEDEFVNGVSSALPGIATEFELREVFHAFDKDGNTGIRPYEFIMKIFR